MPSVTRFVESPAHNPREVQTQLRHHGTPGGPDQHALRVEGGQGKEVDQHARRPRSELHSSAPQNGTTFNVIALLWDFLEPTFYMQLSVIIMNRYV